MIYLVTTEGNDQTWNAFLRAWGKDLRRRIQLIHTHQFGEVKRLPVGTYIFTDHEIQTSIQRHVLGQVWEQLQADGRSRLLNHPTRLLRRYDLLSQLHDRKINRYRIFRCDEIPDDLRFPVFVRLENDHQGSRTPLIRSSEMLDYWLVRASLGGPRQEEIVVIEFEETVPSDGYYRKYGVFNVGGQLVPPYVDIKKDWMVKSGNLIVSHDFESEWKRVQADANEKQPLRIFEIAGVDFGRMDYAVDDGAIQVWEINTNPTMSLDLDDYLPEYMPMADICKTQLANLVAALDDVAESGWVEISLSIR